MPLIYTLVPTGISGKKGLLDSVEFVGWPETATKEKDSMNTIITRHSGLVEWLKQHGVSGEIISHVDDPSQVDGKVVYGILPFHLAAQALAVVTVDMPGLKPEQRGKDISPAEMDLAGASLQAYIIRPLAGDIAASAKAADAALYHGS